MRQGSLNRSLCILAHAPIHEALFSIDNNRLGAIVVIDPTDCVVGIATDGDIRRRLLVDSDLSQPVMTCMNVNFTWVTPEASRELVLKCLDSQSRILPVLDADKRLVDLITRESFRLTHERNVIARARAPVRISFGGGGTDLTKHFFDHGGMVISSTISRYAYATLRRRADNRICVRSADLEGTLELDSIADLKVEGAFGLVAAVIQLVNPSFGFDLEIWSEVPPGSGLGGSASIAAAIAGCFNEFRSDKWDQYELAEIAFHAERLILNIPGGWQDQYASVFGGFNFITFNSELNDVMPLRLTSEVIRELESCLLLCGLGRARIKPATSSAVAPEGEKLKRAKRLKDISVEMRRALVRGRLIEFGSYLNKAWQEKKSLDVGASDSEIDQLYEAAMEAGAIGGKMLGAAGGGYLLLFVPPLCRERVTRRMAQLKLSCESVRFEKNGLQSWKVRMEQEVGV